MELKKLFLVFVFLFLSLGVLVAEDKKDSGQQIGDFTLSGSGEKGKKAWDLADHYRTGGERGSARSVSNSGGGHGFIG